jgi:hypothetical protein
MALSNWGRGFSRPKPATLREHGDMMRLAVSMQDEPERVEDRKLRNPDGSPRIRWAMPAALLDERERGESDVSRTWWFGFETARELARIASEIDPDGIGEELHIEVERDGARGSRDTRYIVRVLAMVTQDGECVEPEPGAYDTPAQRPTDSGE